MTTKIRCYSELKKLRTFDERFDYLKLDGLVGQSTFGFDRYLNQLFYTSDKWRKARDIIIIRDEGNDLGVDGYDINDRIFIHHMNAITPTDIKLDREFIYDPEFLICTTFNTHQAIHYSDENLLIQPIIERYPNDTSPWKRM